MKHWITAICGAIIGAILVYVFMPDPVTVQTPEQRDYEHMKNSFDEVTQEFFEYGRREDSLTREIRRKDTLINKHKTEAAIYKTALNYSADKIKELSRQVLVLKGQEKDSLCDELAHRAQVFIDLYNEYRDRCDSLTAQLDTVNLNLISLNKYSAIKYGELYQSYSDLYKAYQGLVNDQAGLRKSLKRQKLKTTIIAILGVLGTGAALVK